MQIIHLSNKLNKKHMLMYLIVGGVLYGGKCGPKWPKLCKRDHLHSYITAWIDIFKGSRLLWIVNNSVSMCEQ